MKKMFFSQCCVMARRCVMALFCVMTLTWTVSSTPCMAQEEQIPKGVRDFVKYLLTSDMNGLNTILGDSFIYVAPNGYMLDKKGFVNLFKQRKLHIKHMTIVDPVVMPQDDVSILTCDIISHSTLFVTEPVGLQRVTIVIKNDAANNESILLYQATPVQQDAALDAEEAKLIEGLRDGTWKSQ